MAWTSPPREFQDGEIVTAELLNRYVRDNAQYAVATAIESLPAAEPPSPTLLAVAATAALASASQKPLSRRALLGLWRKA